MSVHAQETSWLRFLSNYYVMWWLWLDLLLHWLCYREDNTVIGAFMPLTECSMGVTQSEWCTDKEGNSCPLWALLTLPMTHVPALTTCHYWRHRKQMRKNVSSLYSQISNKLRANHVKQKIDCLTFSCFFLSQSKKKKRTYLIRINVCKSASHATAMWPLALDPHCE